MTVEDNPILSMARKVINAELSLEEAIELAGSDAFAKRVDRAHCSETIMLVQEQSDSYLRCLVIYSELSFAVVRQRNEISPDPTLWAAANFARGNVMAQSGRYQEALQSFSVAQETYQALGDGFLYMWAMCEMSKGNQTTRLANYQQAHKHYHSAKKVFQLLGADLQVADCNLNCAQLYREMALWGEAKEHTDSARLVFVSHDMPDRVAACDESLASILLYQEKSRPALRIYKSLIEFYHRTGLEGKAHQCRVNASQAYRGIGKYHESLRLLEETARFFEEKGLFYDLGVTLSNAASIHHLLGDLAGAVEKFSLARHLFAQMGMRLDAAKCDFNSAGILFEVGDWNKSLDRFQLALGVFKDQGMRAAVAHCEKCIGFCLIKTGQADQGLDLLKSVRDFFERNDMKETMIELDFNLGQCNLESGNYDVAAEIFQRIIDEHPEQPRTLWRAMDGLAETLQRKGRLAEAVALARKAVSLVEQARSNVPFGPLRRTLLFAESMVYYRAIELCLATKQLRQGFEYLEALKTRSLVEVMRVYDVMAGQSATEINDNLEPEEIEGRPAHAPKARTMTEPRIRTDMLRFEEVISLIDADTALVEFFPMIGDTVVFILTKESINDVCIGKCHPDMKSLNATAMALMEQSRQINSGKLRRSFSEFLDRTLNLLYEEIFAVVQPHISGKSRVVLVPYGGLHLLPLHAMFKEERGERRYVVDDYLVSYAPSSSLLQHCLERPIPRGRKACVALANPRNDLYFGQYEADAIAKLLGTHVNRKTTWDDMSEIGRDARIFHFAGHAKDNALILDSGSHEEEEPFGFMDGLLTLDLPETWLATLSACDTGRVSISRTDDYVGLPSAFLCAGARTVVSSLWRVSDSSTMLLMVKMYRLLVGGRGKADSLREAQLWLKDPDNRQEHVEMLKELIGSINEGASSKIADRSGFRRHPLQTQPILPEDLSHPYYWAGFICTGAP